MKKGESNELVLPFQKTSIIGHAVQLCMRAQGATEKEIVALVKKMGGDQRRVFQILRQNGLYTGAVTWELDENRGHLKLLNVKAHNKKK